MTSDDTPARVAADAIVPSAHRAADGSFYNPWPNSESPGWRDTLRMLRERETDSPSASPRRGTFPTATPEITSPRASDSHFAATWIGHATVLLQFGGLNILTDPIFSQRSSPVQWTGPRRVMDPAWPIEKLPPVDVVLLSHNHYDHLDKASVKRIAKENPRTTWIVPLGVGAYIRNWGAREIIELDWWEETVSHGLRVTATPAQHFSRRWLGDRNKSLWCGFAFEIADRRAWFAGDTAYHPDFREIGARCGPFDFVMIPIGAYEPRWFMRFLHLTAEEAVQVYQDLAAAHPRAPLPLMLGMHWGTFRLTSEPMDEPPRLAATRWRAAGLEADRLWIARFGETRIVAR
jgi:N-acyl-phosphatidylethanolamine-hydrolysing phospholipase D